MSASIVRRILPRIVCVLALVLLAAASSPATASATTYYGWFDYARNGSNTNGLLAWGYVVNDMPPIHATYWRAGSGLRPDDGTGGWLPAGFYSVRGHWDNYNGTRIWGRVWYLSDKRGTSGDLRTGLFVHTEETMYNGQYNPTAGDDPKCWEGDIDYRSEGCIKLAYPEDIDRAHWFWNYRGGTTAHGSGWPYPMATRLYVH
ncbi:MAG: hypothetical protein WBJ62_04940 [Coriobacteriia bacterium]